MPGHARFPGWLAAELVDTREPVQWTFKQRRFTAKLRDVHGGPSVLSISAVGWECSGLKVFAAVQAAHTWAASGGRV